MGSVSYVSRNKPSEHIPVKERQSRIVVTGQWATRMPHLKQVVETKRKTSEGECYAVNTAWLRIRNAVTL